MRILVCENDCQERDDLGQHIEALGHVFISVHPDVAEDICNAVYSDKPDMVFMSADSEALDPFTLVTQIKRIRQVPVILLSRNESESFLNQIVSTGANWILTRPFHPSDIKNSIEVALIHHQDQLKIQELEKKLKDVTREYLHRIKNDLTSVVSIMHFQAACCVNEETGECLLENANRILAVTALYDLIRLAEFNNIVRLDDYIELLISKLNPEIDEENNGISFKLETEPISLRAAQALDCGWIVSELVSNAIKHAAPENGENLVIGISVKKGLKKEELELYVSDNGRGMPEDFDPAIADTFGFRLLSLLVEQVKGTMGVERSNGTKIIVRFPAELS